MNELVEALELARPQVSKHLRVLREVGAVDVREDGRQRLYRLDGVALKPIHDWVAGFARTQHRGVRAVSRRRRAEHDDPRRARRAHHADHARPALQHSSVQARDMHINSGMEGGMQETFDKLEQVAISLRG